MGHSGQNEKYAAQIKDFQAELGPPVEPLDEALAALARVRLAVAANVPPGVLPPRALTTVAEEGEALAAAVRLIVVERDEGRLLRADLSVSPSCNPTGAVLRNDEVHQNRGFWSKVAIIFGLLICVTWIVLLGSLVGSLLRAWLL